jgi:hypothetical protein
LQAEGNPMPYTSHSTQFGDAGASDTRRSERGASLRLRGVTITTQDLATITDHFRANARPMSLEVDGQAFSIIDDVIERITEDMAVERVMVAIPEDAHHSLEFVFSPQALFLRTDGSQDTYRRTFMACAALLATRPLNGTTLCEIANPPRPPPHRTATGPAPLLHALRRLWLPTGSPHHRSTKANSVPDDANASTDRSRV